MPRSQTARPHAQLSRSCARRSPRRGWAACASLLRLFSPRPGAAGALFVGIALLLGVSSAAAQTLTAPPSPSPSAPDTEISGQVSFRAGAGIPLGSFGENVGTGGGLSLFIGGYLDDLPLTIGLDVGYVGYGRSMETAPLSQSVGPRVNVEVETQNSILQPHLLLRLQPKTGRVRPFVDGLVGFRYLYTRTSARGRSVFGAPEDAFASTTNFDDFAFSAGTGAGIDLRVYQQDDPAKDVRTMSIHLGVQYLWGQEAEYLAEGDLVDTNANNRLDREELPIRQSRTTLVQPQVGLAIQL